MDSSTAITNPVDRVLTLPNVLSAARLMMVPIFAWLMWQHQLTWAVILLMVSGITDYLDGMIARRWHQTSTLGQLLDPLADRLFIASTLIGLAWQGVISWWLVAVLAARDAVLALAVLRLARCGYRPIPVHVLGKAATLSLLYAFPLLLLSASSGPLATVSAVVGWAFAGWGVGLYLWTGWLYLRHTRLILERTLAEQNDSGDRSSPLPLS